MSHLGDRHALAYGLEAARRLSGEHRMGTQIEWKANGLFRTPLASSAYAMTVGAGLLF